jgi:hypothetical protein
VPSPQGYFAVAVVAPISGFIPNPPIVATLVPVLES